MSIPGLNLLALASTVIRPQETTYFRWLGKTTNDIGYDVPTFAAGVTVYGSFQPVKREKFETLGLDFSKEYATFYATGAFRPVMRSTQPDQFAFNGKRWEVVDLVDWFAQDGWQAALLENVGPA